MTTVILGDLVNPGAPAYNETPVRRGRIVRSSAHDWKSCIPQGIEGSNPSLSATHAASRPDPWGGLLLSCQESISRMASIPTQEGLD